MKSLLQWSSRLIVLAACVTAVPSLAQEAVVTYKSLAPDAAFELARVALQTCRTSGYQVAVVVMDRFGEPLVICATALSDCLRRRLPRTRPIHP